MTTYTPYVLRVSRGLLCGVLAEFNDVGVSFSDSAFACFSSSSSDASLPNDDTTVSRSDATRHSDTKFASRFVIATLCGAVGQILPRDARPVQESVLWAVGRWDWEACSLSSGVDLYLGSALSLYRTDFGLDQAEVSAAVPPSVRAPAVAAEALASAPLSAAKGSLEQRTGLTSRTVSPSQSGPSRPANPNTGVLPRASAVALESQKYITGRQAPRAAFKMNSALKRLFSGGTATMTTTIHSLAISMSRRESTRQVQKLWDQGREMYDTAYFRRYQLRKPKRPGKLALLLIVLLWSLGAALDLWRYVVIRPELFSLSKGKEATHRAFGVQGDGNMQRFAVLALMASKGIKARLAMAPSFTTFSVEFTNRVLNAFESSTPHSFEVRFESGYLFVCGRLVPLLEAASLSRIGTFEGVLARPDSLDRERLSNFVVKAILKFTARKRSFGKMASVLFSATNGFIPSSPLKRFESLFQTNSWDIASRAMNGSLGLLGYSNTVFRSNFDRADRFNSVLMEKSVKQIKFTSCELDESFVVRDFVSVVMANRFTFMLRSYDFPTEEINAARGRYSVVVKSVMTPGCEVMSGESFLASEATRESDKVAKDMIRRGGGAILAYLSIPDAKGTHFPVYAWINT
ncbi:hypothetical protein C8J56DRAFT_1087940 [Mycena floridula]|nr:hypothetical protein C8J56DRAFT_1087940 [Mycena floridula]